VIADAGLTWLLSAWFAALGIVALLGAIRAARRVERASYVAHLAMAAAMAVMPWSWSMLVPSGLWVGLFGAAAAGYALLAITRPAAAIGPGAGHHRGRAVTWYHAGMMLAMVWMALVTGPLAPPMRLHADPGMKVAEGGHAMPAMAAAILPLDGSGSPFWIAAIALMLAAAFFIASVGFLRRLRSTAPDRGGRPLPARLDVAFSAAMALGTAVMFLTTA